MRHALIALGLLVLAGCSSTCKDGNGRASLFNGFQSNYHACDFECCRGEKECRCSGTCPCWKQENHPK
jgi:hypothetical protein